jgi:hypothetical protein
MPSSNKDIEMSLRENETVEALTPPVMSKTSAGYSSNSMSMEQWLQNGTNRPSDQKTLFPKAL